MHKKLKLAISIFNILLSLRFLVDNNLITPKILFGIYFTIQFIKFELLKKVLLNIYDLNFLFILGTILHSFVKMYEIDYINLIFLVFVTRINIFWD